MTYMNQDMTTTEKAMGMAGQIYLPYNSPVNVPAHFVAVAPKTNQSESTLAVQNLSNTFEATFTINPNPPGHRPVVTIPANDRTPRYFTHNWNGARLAVSNVSQESAAIQVSLYGQA